VLPFTSGARAIPGRRQEEAYRKDGEGQAELESDGMRDIFQETIHTITPLDRQAGHFPGNDPHDYALRPACKAFSR